MWSSKKWEALSKKCKALSKNCDKLKRLSCAISVVLGSRYGSTPTPPVGFLYLPKRAGPSLHPLR